MSYVRHPHHYCTHHQFSAKLYCNVYCYATNRGHAAIHSKMNLPLASTIIMYKPHNQSLVNYQREKYKNIIITIVPILNERRCVLHPMQSLSNHDEFYLIALICISCFLLHRR